MHIVGHIIWEEIQDAVQIMFDCHVVNIGSTDNTIRVTMPHVYVTQCGAQPNHRFTQSCK